MGKPKRIKKRQAKAASKRDSKEDSESDKEQEEEEDDGRENTFEAVFGDAELFDWGAVAAEKLLALDDDKDGESALIPSFDLDMGNSFPLLMSQSIYRSATTSQIK